MLQQELRSPLVQVKPCCCLLLTIGITIM